MFPTGKASTGLLSKNLTNIQILENLTVFILSADKIRIQCTHYRRRDVPVGVPLDLSTPTGMSCIGRYGENCKSDNVSKYRVLLFAFLLIWHEN